MIKTFLKTAFRQIRSNKLIFTIDVAILSVTVAACLIIGVNIINHHQFDTFHSKSNHIVRVDYIYKDSENLYHDLGLMDNSFFDDFRKDLPQVIHSTRYRTGHEWAKNVEKSVKVSLAFVDSTFLESFDFKLLAGAKENVLDDPGSIVITKSVAEKLFGKQNGGLDQFIGQTVTLPNAEQKDFNISGILEDLPKQSSMDFDVLVNFNHSATYPRSSDGMGDTNIFLELNNESNIENTETALQGLVGKYFGEQMAEWRKYGYLSNDNDALQFKLRPFPSLYLDNKATHNYLKSTDTRELGMMKYIALVIFILAVVNHITLSINQSVKRVNELNIKKVIGAGRYNLILQFFTESVFLSLISVVGGLILYMWIYPLMQEVFDWNLNAANLLVSDSILLILGLFLAIILLTCLAPVIKLISPGSFRFSSNKLAKTPLSRGFMVFQYCVSFVLITSAILIFKQLEYMRSKELGFDQEGVMVIKLADSFSDNQRSRLTNLLAKHSSIENIATSDRDFVSGSQTRGFQLPNNKGMQSRFIRIEKDYVNTLGLSILEGKNLDADRIEQEEVLVNQTFIKESGLLNPIGQSLDLELVEGRKTIIAGIVKDFHFDAVKGKIQALVITNAKINGIWNIFVRYRSGRLDDARAYIEHTWAEVEPELPLQISFLDENLQNRYQKEERFGRVITYSSVIAILITSFGLFSLSLITLTSRIKEIGIRKVNGALSIEIYSRFVQKYFGWVAIAIVLGIPISWFLIDSWLQNFSYRTSVDWWIFVLSGVLALLIALFTVSWHSWKAATRNPVEALRYE